MKDEILYWFGVQPLDYLQRMDEKRGYCTTEKNRERTAAAEKRGKIAQKCTSLLLSFAIEVVVMLPLSY